VDAFQELVTSHVDVLQDLVQVLAEIGDRYLAVTARGYQDRLVTGDLPAAYLVAENVGSAAIAVFDVTEVVVNTGLVVVEILVIAGRSFDP